MAANAILATMKKTSQVHTPRPLLFQWMAWNFYNFIWWLLWSIADFVDFLPFTLIWLVKMAGKARQKAWTMFNPYFLLIIVLETAESQNSSSERFYSLQKSNINIRSDVKPIHVWQMRWSVRKTGSVFPIKFSLLKEIFEDFSTSMDSAQALMLQSDYSMAGCRPHSVRATRNVEVTYV